MNLLHAPWLLQEDRYAEIERDNRLLLEKMSHIMRKGGVDNHDSTSKYAKSLNKGARKKELHKITRENQVHFGLFFIGRLDVRLCLM